MAAPVRTPRPSRLERALELSAEGGARARRRSGLRTVGDLLEHVPRARREARTVGALAPGETATVLVEVRAIARAPGAPPRHAAARRGDRRRRDRARCRRRSSTSPGS